MRRIGVWVLLVALGISLFRICISDKQDDASFQEENWNGFIYRSPWNGEQQLTVLGTDYSGVLWTQAYPAELIATLEAGCYVTFSKICAVVNDR